MREFLIGVWNVVQGWDWLKVVEALASVWVAWVATKALKTWKVQSKAERQGRLLDGLIEAVHEYLSLIGRPLTVAESVKIGMKSHEPIGLAGDQSIAGAGEYIKRAGADDSKRLFEALGTCRNSYNRIRSLVVKGQTLHFTNYSRGYNSATMITHQVDKLEALAALISTSSMNWENPIARQALEKVFRAIDVDVLRKELETQHLEFLAFAKDAYAQIYK
jgi:hypothetical protein